MKPRFEDIQAALFDLDGTLVETCIDFALMKRTVLALASEELGSAADFEGLDILAVISACRERLDMQGRRLDAARFEHKALQALEDIEVRHAANTREIPFAGELIDRLRSRGVKIGIVTRNCRRASEMSLRMVGISPDVLICREDSTTHKPLPEQVYLALRMLGVAPERAVMVGDHLMDVQSGKAAGTGTIGFLRNGRPHDFFDAVAPDLVVQSLREVLDAIVGRDS